MTLKPVQKGNILLTSPRFKRMLPFCTDKNDPKCQFLGHDLIWKESQQDVTLLSWLYAGYRTQRRLGRYPIPTLLIQKWNDRGYEIFTWLKDEGVIIDPKTKFYFVSNNLTQMRAKNPSYLSTCKFYEVRRLVEVSPKDKGLELLLSLAETYTQSQIARLLGVTQPQISQILSGKRGLSPELTKIITEVRVINNNIGGGA